LRLRAGPRARSLAALPHRNIQGRQEERHLY
jgi:hypothetical protein